MNRKNSRARAMQAMCHMCSGFEFIHEDCKSPNCPLYAFRKNREMTPDYWWTKDKRFWKEGYGKTWALVKAKWTNYFTKEKNDE